MRSTVARSWCAAALAAAAFLSPEPIRAGGSLIDAIRRNDVAVVNQLIADGADVARADDSGATPLMHAALLAGPECLMALIEHGAQVNVGNAYGATPLMWAAAHRADNVRLLLDRGARVNDRASDGATALVAATRFGNTDAMRALLDAGADVSTPSIRTALLTAAYNTPAAAARDVLASAQVVPESPADFAGPVLIRYRHDAMTLDRLLAAGVDPREQVPLITLSLPTFFIAAREGQIAAMDTLVKAGMDPNFRGPRGWTALMLAAGGDAASVPAMQYLIDAGADVNAVDEDGRNALDWALTRGTTAASMFLKSVGAKPAFVPSAPPAAVKVPRTAALAIEKAVAQLQPAGPSFHNRTKCTSCHNQSIPGIAITKARHHGVPMDLAIADHSMSASHTQWRNRREAVLLGEVAAGGFQANAQYTLLEMAESRMPPTANSDAIVLGLASRQMPDGSWPIGAEIRPPLNGTAITSTALALRGLREYAPEGRRRELEIRLTRALAFLRAQHPRDTQDQAFKLLGLVWGSGSPGEIAAERAALVALQRTDGGWAQMPSLEPDAYATGQALYALHSARVPAADPVYRKGVDFLLRTQLDDGTWFVRTRAFGFQPYFETGFPHGRSQFISTVATAWAVTALTFTLE